MRELPHGEYHGVSPVRRKRISGKRPGEHQHFRGDQKDKKKPAKENKCELRDQAGEGTS